MRHAKKSILKIFRQIFLMFVENRFNTHKNMKKEIMKRTIQ